MRFQLPTVLTGVLFAATAIAGDRTWSAGGGSWPTHAPSAGWSQYCDKDQCSPVIVSLATGIHLNIVGQEGELNATEALLTIEGGSSVNQTAFLIGKGELIANVLGGMKIRLFNQAILPAGNPATAGLAEYAAAQQTELALSESLTGVASHDIPILDTLVSDIKAGIILNMNNLANATEGCNLGVVFPSVLLGF